MLNEFETTRVPGLRPRIFGRSSTLMSRRRNVVITLALEKSVSNRSALTKVALSATPASSAFVSTVRPGRGLYSTPRARAPRLAALITRRPSPEPRSMTRSSFVTLAMSSIFSTTTCGVGTQTTSAGRPTSSVQTGLLLARGSRVASACACALTAASRQAPKGQPGRRTTTSGIQQQLPDKADV